MEFIDSMKFKFIGKTNQDNYPKEILEDAGVPFSAEKVSRIHAETTITGTFTSSDNFYFNGRLVGDIKLENKLVLGEKTQIIGNIFAVNLICLGKIEGQVYVREKAMFGRSSQFKGKISAPVLEVENGAIFNAECFMESSEVPVPEPVVSVREIPVDKPREKIPEEVSVSAEEVESIVEENSEISFLNGIFRSNTKEE
ncbi:MAG: polymer-forming cytoskeletal protein [Bacteroidota bacterium]|nr:polymer-forming cytoskeletal protein [Bacteroidota bacterium]